MDAPKQYEYPITTFSPSGRLIQLEYGFEAAEREALTVGIVASDGVVIASENKECESILVEDNYTKRVEIVTGHIGMVFSGLQPDYRLLVSHARKETQKYLLSLKDKMPVAECVKTVGKLMQAYTKNSGVRPFGVTLLICGWYDNKPQLFQIDPSGLNTAWKAIAIGRNAEGTKAFLKKNCKKGMKLKAATNLAIRAIKAANDGQNVKIDVGCCNKSGFSRMDRDEVQKRVYYS